MPTAPPAIKVVVVEHDNKLRAFLVALLGGAPGLSCVGSYRTVESALTGLSRERPDVLLVDFDLPQDSGIDLTRQAADRWPQSAVLALTIRDDPKLIVAALEAGAVGYLVKPVAAARLLEAIAEAHAGGSPLSTHIARLVVRRFQEHGHARRQIEALTTREAEVLDHLAHGRGTAEVAAALRISRRTVASHLSHAYEKLHVHSRAAAVARLLGGNG